jgi:hypothetical protein
MILQFESQDLISVKDHAKDIAGEISRTIVTWQNEEGTGIDRNISG